MGGEDTHHLVKGVAQKAVLVEDEEPALPFLQRNTQELGGSGLPPHVEPLHLTGLLLRPAGSTAFNAGASGVEEQGLVSQDWANQRPQPPSKSPVTEA